MKEATLDGHLWDGRQHRNAITGPPSHRVFSVEGNLFACQSLTQRASAFLHCASSIIAVLQERIIKSVSYHYYQVTEWNIKSVKSLRT
jgi:hypothetical protein